MRGTRGARLRRRACATHAARSANTKGGYKAQSSAQRAEGMQELEEHAPLVRDLETLRKTMTDDVGIVRSFSRLERAKRMLALLSNEVNLIWQRSIPTRELVELRNLILVASHITDDALNRDENRGLHWNKDLI